MKFTLATALLAAALMMAGGAAPAIAGTLSFDFSFQGNSTNPGTITGEIFGLSDNSTGAAAAVDIFTSTITAPFSLPYDTLFDTVSANAFTVTSGQITGADFDVLSLSGHPFYALEINEGGDLNDFTNGAAAVDNSAGLSGITFTPVGTVVAAVPEPLTLSIFGAGLAGAFAMRRKKKAA